MSTVVLPPASREDPPSASCPYRGLQPYAEADAGYFFGRETDTERVTANLIAKRLTVLYAPSGVGKTSILLAGVVHQMRKAARRAVSAGHDPDCLPVVARDWTGDPLVEIRTRVGEGIRAVFGDSVRAPGDDTSRGLRSLFEHAAEATGAKLVLLLLDQFEEFLLYHGDLQNGGTTAMLELAELIRASEVDVNVLIAIREDAWATMDRFKGHVSGLSFDASLRLPHLDRAAAERAVVEPLALWNREHPPEERMEIERGLTSLVLDQVATGAIALGRAGGGGSTSPAESIEAPFLQLVLTRIWEKERAAGSHVMRRETLDELGGATEIVRTHLDRLMEELSDAEQDIAAALFHRLVTPSGAKVALRVGDLAAWTGVAKPDLQRVLGSLSHGDWRIVRAIDHPAPRGDDPSYEIFHDVLAEPVLDWRARHEKQRETREAEAAAREAERRRWMRRLRLGLLAAGLAVVATIAILAIIAWQQSREAQEQRWVATSRELAATSQLVTDPELGILLAAEALRRRRTSEAVGALRAGLAADRSLGVLPAGDEAVRGVDTTANGRRVLGFGDDGRLRAWNVADRRQLFDVEASTGALAGARFSPDARRIVSAGKDGRVVVWDAANGRRLATLTGRGPASGGAEWDSAGRRVLVVTPDAATVWDATSGRRLRALRGEAIASAHWHPRDARRAVTAERDGTVRIWDVRGGDAVASVETGSAVRDAMFNARGTAVLTIGDRDSVAHVWTPAGDRKLVLRHPTAARVPLMDATFDRSGRRVATAGLDHRVRIWNARTGATETILTGHGSYVTDIEFSPDDSTVATAGNDRSARIWDAATGDPLSTLDGHDSWISDVSFPTEDLIATAGMDGDVRLWKTGEVQLAVMEPRDTPDTVSFSRDGGLVVIGTYSGVELRPWPPSRSRQAVNMRVPGGVNTASLSPDGRLVVIGAAYDENPSAPALVLRVPDGGVRGKPLAVAGRGNGAVTAAFSPDGRLILTAHRDGAARLWSSRTQELVRRLGPAAAPSNRATLIDAQFSSDGRRVATVGASGVVRVFDPSSGRELRSFAVPTGSFDVLQLNAVALQPGGDLVATAGEDGLALLWDLRTGKARPLHHDDAVTSVAFSPDGGVVATASWDRSARLWDARTAQPLGVLKRMPAAVASVAFSPDGRRLVTADWTERVRVFACGVCGSVEVLRRSVRAAVRRQLTRDERLTYLREDDG